MTLSEPQICELLLFKDQNGFSYLYQHYSAALFSEIMRIVKMQHTAEDILQETFIQIFRQVAQYDANKGGLFTWMIVIARNKSIDYLRSARNKYEGKISQLAETFTCPENTMYETNIENYLVNKQIALLPPRSREVLHLIYRCGYTNKEVAITQQIPVGTVKTRLRIALQQLRKLYGCQPRLLVTIK